MAGIEISVVDDSLPRAGTWGCATSRSATPVDLSPHTRAILVSNVLTERHLSVEVTDIDRTVA